MIYGPVPPERIATLLATRRPAPSNREAWYARLGALGLVKPHAARRQRLLISAEVLAMWDERRAAERRARDRTRGHEEADAAAALQCPQRAPSVRGLTAGECQVQRRCFLCGRPVMGRRRVWCSNECIATWLDNHSWSSARHAALRRDEYRCVRDASHRSPKEVNHRDPRNGHGYHLGCHHHLDRLETLCHDCHAAVTTQQGRERAVPTGASRVAAPSEG